MHDARCSLCRCGKNRGNAERFRRATLSELGSTPTWLATISRKHDYHLTCSGRSRRLLGCDVHGRPTPTECPEAVTNLGHNGCYAARSVS